MTTTKVPATYESLKVEYNQCPADCRLCEDACARVKAEGKKARSRVKLVKIPQVGFYGAMTCIQCGDPKCLKICPAGAIEKATADGVVRIQEEKCIGCGLCTLACPYGGIYYSPETHKSFKCDRCDGDPECVKACPYEVITKIENQPVLSCLKEDVMAPGTAACRGCPAELAIRFTLRLMGKDTVIFGAPGCAIAFIIGFGSQAHVRIPEVTCLLGNTAATMTGVYRYYRRIGKEAKLVAFVGDGATVDIGFQALSGAAERGENFIYICYDNEGYMNTGVQRSGSTPFGARTYTSPVGKMRRGKQQSGKNLPLLMLFHGVPYVATATIAHPEDYAAKLQKAMQVKDGLAYIHLYSPCPTGWGLPEDEGLDVARLAVDTNYFPLWEAEHGQLRLTHEVKRPRPVSDYIKMLGKYSHLTPDEIKKIQDTVDSKYKTVYHLSSSGILCKV